MGRLRACRSGSGDGRDRRHRRGAGRGALASLRAEGVHRAILTVWDEDRDGALRALDRFAAVRDELDGR